MMRRAHLRTLRPEWLTIEIMRQVEAFRSAFGRAPDFVDGHQHVQLFPQIGEALLRVVKDAAPNAWVRQCGRTLPAHRRLGDRKALLLDALSRRFRRLAARHGVRTNPGFAGAYAFRPHPTTPSCSRNFSITCRTAASSCAIRAKRTPNCGGSIH